MRRWQANRWAEQDAQQYAEQPASSEPPPPQPSAPSTDDKLAQLEELGELKSSGVLTEAEFEAQKAKILAE